MATELSRYAGIFLWSALTLLCYLAAKTLYRRQPRWWASPLLLTPMALLALTATFHVHYTDYLRGTDWMSLMLGPVMVAFALPIYEQRAIIRRHWPILLIGVAVGSTIAITSAWGLATLLHLAPDIRASLMPRSITTPLAMAASADLGGIPQLTALFVILTGVFGAAIGDRLMTLMALRSPLARGALLGMGAQGAGVARARELGREEGSVASLVMVLAGLLNIAAAPLLAHCLG